MNTNIYIYKYIYILYIHTYIYSGSALHSLNNLITFNLKNLYSALRHPNMFVILRSRMRFEKTTWARQKALKAAHAFKNSKESK